MELKEVIKQRRSIRKFKSTPIPREDIQEIIQAATLAPSAHNKQMWHFIAISNKKILKEMTRAVLKKIEEINQGEDGEELKLKLKGIRAYSTFFVKAPLVFAVLVKPYFSMIEEIRKKEQLKSGKEGFFRPHLEIQSVSAAIENLLLAATEKGYGTCWMCGPLIASSELKKILNIEDPWELMALIPMGIPAQELKPKMVKKVEEVLDFIE